MASWIIHMRIAQKLIEEYLIEEKEAFIIGSIAPDSGIPQENGGYLPSKDISHFKTINHKGKMEIDPDAFIQAYMTDNQNKHYSKHQYYFYLGYLTHLASDVCWKELIIKSAILKYNELYNENKKAFWSKINPDWYQLDFKYLIDHPDFIAYQVIKKTQSFKNRYIKEFSEDAFERSLERISDYYDEEVRNYEERETYLSEHVLDDFVNQVVSYMIQKYSQYFE